MPSLRSVQAMSEKDTKSMREEGRAMHSEDKEQAQR